jgi:hypothetical protein
MIEARQSTESASVRDEYLHGNMGGAVRIGATVHRATGPWTPAVHALLAYLDGRLPHVPKVHGFDEQGREVLDFMAGRIVDIDSALLTEPQIASLVRWTRALHDATRDFAHPGPWRHFPIPDATIIGHNDIATYNSCFDGDELAGVFDWDMSGPTTPLLELAFIAWNAAPLWQENDPTFVAARLKVIAARYRDGPDAMTILRAVPRRIQIMIDGIPVAAAAGDQGMADLMSVGEPARSRRALGGLLARMAAIERALQ